MPRNKGKRGFVKGLNHKIRVMQRRAYGYRDEAYPRLNILTAFLTRKWIIHPLESALSRYNFFRRGAPCYTNYSCFGLSEALPWWWPAW